MGKGFFRVLVALPLDSAAGRKKLNGIHRFLCEGHDWDMELVRNSSRFTADSLNDARNFDGMLIGFTENRSSNASTRILASPRCSSIIPMANS